MICEHGTVYGEEGVFAGWPANHGAWQRGDEFLVGFMRGPFAAGKNGHRIREPFEKMQARSLDGGLTWTVETPNVDFEAASLPTHAPAWDLSTSLYRGCGIYDTGGEHCVPEGGFYLSEDFGHQWHGPYAFNGLDLPPQTGCFVTARTAYLTASQLVFISYAWRGFDDCTLMMRVTGQGDFDQVRMVLNDKARAVMPAVAEAGGKLWCAMRRRDARRCWIDLYSQRRPDWPWEFEAMVAETGGHNGNPPAMVAVDDHLVLAYANRSDCSMKLAVRSPRGTWGGAAFRQGTMADIGYPRLFVREDGRVVCVYYYSDAGEAQAIERTVVTF